MPGVPFADEAQQLGARVVSVDDRISDVRAIETRDEHARVAQREPLDDLLARERIGGGGERDARRVGKAFVQRGELQVLRAEVVAPLRDAVRLVDRDQRDMHSIEQFQEAGRDGALGRDVEQVEFARAQRRLDLARFARGERGVERRCAHAGLTQRGDLVLHQRDQRRDDDPASLAQQRRQLVTHRLAAAGRHQHERVARADQVHDDLVLLAAKRVVAEDPAQYLQRGGGVHGRTAALSSSPSLAAREGESATLDP